jgi:hypothetical protein
MELLGGVIEREGGVEDGRNDGILYCVVVQIYLDCVCEIERSI